MKIKKVEISAFRIYDKPENATFDFTINSGEAADFVSLYAPNGFGKTSFYDAVEWGMTNHISRFQIRGKENESLNDSQNDQKKRTVIRNIKSSKGLKTRVRIDTTKKTEEREWKRHGKNRYDIDFTNPKKIENPEFQAVILSQEWISSFLTEVKGDERFVKFMKHPDFNEIDTYYKNVLGLKGELDSKKLSHENEIGRLRSELSEFSDPGLLEKVNFQITLINQKFELDLEPIRLDTNDQGIKELKDRITSNAPTQSRLDQIKENIEAVSFALNGSNQLDGVKQFFQNKKRNTIIQSEVDRLNKIISQFDRLSECELQFSNNTKQLSDLKDQLKEATEVEKLFEQYSATQTRIADKYKALENSENKIKDSNVDIEDAKRDILSRSAEVESLVNKISEFEDTLKQLPDQSERLSKALAKKEKIEEESKEFQVPLKNQLAKLSKVEERLTEIRKELAEIKGGQWPLNSPKELTEIDDLLVKIISDQRQLKSTEEELKELRDVIMKQQELNSAIEQFIKQGLDLVNQNHTSTCPLCEHEYGSYQKLADRISGNQALGKVLQKLLEDQSALEGSRSELKGAIEINTGKAVLAYQKLIKSMEDNEKEFSRQLDTLKDQEKSKQEELQSINEEVTSIRTSFKGLSGVEFRKEIESQIEKCKGERDTKSQELGISKEKLGQIEKDLNLLKERIALLKSEIDGHKNEESYLTVLRWIDKNLSGIIDEKVEVTRFLGNLIEEIKTLEPDQSRLKQEIQDLKESLEKSSLKRTQSKVREFTIEKEQNQKRIDSYEFHLKNIGISFIDKSQEEIEGRLNDKNLELKSDLEKLAILRDELERLSGYVDNLKEFLQSERIKLKIKKEEEELTFLKEVVEPKLTREKEKVVMYLEEKIQDFFQTDLIDQLYNKIDPHPEFKKVKFKPNFDNDIPRLDVFVSDETGKESLVPNLYFSTAQINILSLCIFLATALTSKEYDCIFVDDPVQSMDSINVLSTIDLLRSLSVLYDKQIILSTHDENFHRLMQKKIPSSLFKSKFLELESFGKVKAQKQ